jgi:hypothetical protein
MRQVAVISYRHFVTNCRSQKSLKIQHYSLSNNPEEDGSYLLRGGSLKSRIKIIVGMGKFCVWLGDKVIVYV